MKKALYLLAVILILSFGASPKHTRSFIEPIDTVRLLNVSLSAEQWAWFVGLAEETGGGVQPRVKRKIREMSRAVPSATWNTQLVLDTLPGKAALWMYKQYMSVSNGIAERVGTTFRTKFRAFTNNVFATFKQEIDAAADTSYTRTRELGRQSTSDQ